MRLPKIGVFPLWDDEKKSIWMLPGYLDGIEQAGGIPVILPYTENNQILDTLSDTLDGFLFTGGHDVSPALYGEQPLPSCGTANPVRDYMEHAIFHRAVLRQDKPAFGICRGIQLFNALLGGSLYQHLPEQFPAPNLLRHQQTPPYDRPAHTVAIIENSPLAQLIQTPSIAVNSYHHQGIQTLSDELRPMAAAEDGLIEAVYRPASKFLWAVQWHPEYALKKSFNQALFSVFIHACRNEN